MKILTGFNFFPIITAALISFYTPVWFLFTTIMLFITLDFISGVTVSIRLNGWSSITSSRLKDTLGKVLMYQLIVLTMFPLDFYILNEILSKWFVQFALTKFLACFIVYIESVSVKENMEKLLNISFYDKLKALFKFSREMHDDFDNITKKKDV